MEKKKKSPRRSSAPKIIDLDAEQRKLALIKQKQCDTIALNIVEKLIDGPVEEDVFLQSLKYLNQCHYQDIVEERAITKLCGYPICTNDIKDMPAKKFHISTKTNKVYDITERKNYCSNFCYKAGIFIKEQMLISPLWYRDQEEIPDFHLLPKTENGIPGQEIDQGLLKLDPDEENFISVSKFTQDMINDIPENVGVDVEESIPIVPQEVKRVDIKEEEEIKAVVEESENKIKIDQKKTSNEPEIKPEKFLNQPEIKPEFDMSFSNIFGPSIADILKENAEYFKNDTTSKNLTKNSHQSIKKNSEIKKENIKKLESTSNKTVQNKNNNKEFKIKINDKDSKIETKTVINEIKISDKYSKIETKPAINRIKINDKYIKKETKPVINKISETIEIIKNLEHKTDEPKPSTSNNAEHKKFETKFADIFEIIGEEAKKIFDDIDEEQNIIDRPKPEFFNVIFDNPVPDTTKGILKKPKEKKPKKKRVSFTMENSIKEIPPNENKEKRTDPSRKFKKPDSSKSEENTGPRFKNTNLIGTVQERSNTYENTTKKEMKIEVSKKTSNENVEKRDNKEKVNETKVENNQNKNKLQNTTQEILVEQKINNSDSAEKQESTKEKRLSRLKNSSAYKKNRFSNSTLQPKKAEISDLKTKLDTCISDWFTFDTVLFLYGEEQVKKYIEEKSFKHYLNKKKNMELDEQKQKQYDEICKRLNLMELTDQNFDESITGKKRRPLPRYEDIRQQAEHMDLRVQAFYSACYETNEEDGDTDTESMRDEDDIGAKPQAEQGQPAVLPLVDNKDVMATRRRIFHTCVSRVIPSLCEILQESPNRLLSEIKHLINTFEFTARNIIFKSADWEFVTLLLIKILSIRDKDLQTTLATADAVQYFSSLARECGLEDKNIEEILTKLQLQNILHDSMRKFCEE